MNKSLKIKLEKLGLNSANSIVIGSGILSELKIRNSNDVDILIDFDRYDELKAKGEFKEIESYGDNALVQGDLEIRTSWRVLGKKWNLQDLMSHTTLIDSISYNSLEFLLEVKEDWSQDKSPRQKDINDVVLIKKYLE